MRLLNQKDIKTNPDLQEIAVRDPAFPIAMYYNDFNAYVAGEAPWHWHEDVEFTLILEDSLEIDVGQEQHICHKGDGLFINSNQLHAMRSSKNTRCIAVSIVLDPIFIIGSIDSIISQKYIFPFLHHSQITSLPLRAQNPDHLAIIKAIESAYLAYEANEFGCEIMIRNYFSKALLNIMKLSKNTLEYRSPHKDDSKIKRMLTFIENNYANQISLEDIAESANVSISECCRCFREILHTTPFSYLLSCRIRQATHLLSTTDMNITEICFSVGFNHLSYFGKTFRKQTGLSPRKYRSQNRQV